MSPMGEGRFPSVRADGVYGFDVNLSILFTELPLLERPEAAAKAGFDAVELWWPFDGPVPADLEMERLRRAIQDAGVRLVGLNFDAGNMASGDRGLLSEPRTSDRFRANVEVAVGFADSLGCRVLNALYGNRAEDVPVEEQREVALGNLLLAAEAAAGVDAVVVVEALNSYENPRYPITSSAAAFEVIDEVGVPNVAFLADLYHLHRMGEDVLELIDRSVSRFGHVQIADDPGRGEPGSGGMPFREIFDRLAVAGYRGHVGLEYRPTGPSADSFAWRNG